jgi:hypothetical protein
MEVEAISTTTRKKKKKKQTKKIWRANRVVGMNSKLKVLFT